MFAKVVQILACLVLVHVVYGADPDASGNTSDIIRSRGFISQEHVVETDDGYLITIFRIVHPSLNSSGKPVLMMHPLVGESANWIINSRGGFVNESTDIIGNNLGFELAKRGYDVWLGNVRGNVNARRHRTLSVDDGRFWQFSIDQHSAIDVPAMIHHIQRVTGQPKIDYVGHSQGTMLMFALLSRTPEYSQVIDRFIALGPVAFLGQVTTPFRYLLDTFIFKLYLYLSSGEFLPPDTFLVPLARYFCPYSLSGTFCTNFLFLVCGYSNGQIEKDRLPVIVAHAPAGTSKQNMLHYLQLVSSRKFRMFDYGHNKNIATYGSAEPPDYDLSRINHPKISLIWAQNDALADPADVQLLKNNLQVKLADDYRIPLKQFNHLDFLWAKDAGKYVNSKVLEILSRSDS